MPAVVLAVIGLLAAAGLLVVRRLRALTKSLERVSTEARQLAPRLQELEVQRSQAQTILDNMMESVAALDRDGRILWLNPSAHRLMGVRHGEGVGQRLVEVFRQPEVEELIKDTLTRAQPSAREVQMFSPQERTLRMQASPCEGGAQDAALVWVAQDVTDMRRLEGLRREFVANVSHELKTPLTSIKGLVETLLNGALEDASSSRRFVALIDEEAARLGRLIDDLLELSQIESKAMPLRVEPVAVHGLVEEVAAQLRRQMEEHRITFENRVPQDTPPVRADAGRLRQVFVNLVDNAVKFNSPGGRVVVSAAPSGARLEITVEDTGIGIPEADLPRIFERFYRVDKARSRELGGTGLGLSIIKHLVDLHQGRITVRSRLGEGTVFTVSLPLWPAHFTS